jgi:UDP-glucose 6-dehydrogenase
VAPHILLAPPTKDLKNKNVKDLIEELLVKDAEVCAYKYVFKYTYSHTYIFFITYMYIHKIGSNDV